MINFPAGFNLFETSKHIKHLGLKARTPFGFQTIEYVHRTVPLPTIAIIHERGSIEVALTHSFIIQGKEIPAMALKVGDSLETIHGLSKILEIKELGERVLYDISLDQHEMQNEWYYTAGVLSHNSGKSITVACYLVWMFNFWENRNIGIVANRGAQAKEFLNNVKNIFSRLPMWIMAGITEWNKTSIANENAMRVLTDVPTSDSFRGYAIHCIWAKSKVTLRDKSGFIFESNMFKLWHSDCIQMDGHLSHNKGLEILTSSGFQPFMGVRRTKAKGLKIIHTGGKIGVTEGHLFATPDGFKAAKDFTVGDKLGKFEILEIIPYKTKRWFYDPIEVNGDNTYIADGLVHHNCLVIDECAFIKTQNWEEFADSIFPSQSALAWKKNIIISTANGINHFYDLVQKARQAEVERSQGHKTLTKLVEVDWREVPRYGSDGNLISPEEFRDNIIKRYGRPYFEQNYGNSFVGSTETLFDPEVLDAFVPGQILEEWSGLKVYELPEPGKTYVMGVDAAKDGKDFFAVQIFDVSTFPFKQVAAAQLQVNYLDMPELLYEWGAEYNSALMIIENNEGAGQSVADTLVNHYEYPNMHYDDGKKYPGFRTTPKSRDAIVKLLQILGNSNKLVIRDKATIDEFMKFELINGKYQASDGHDDLVMALAMTISPLAKFDNFEDFGLFLRTLKSDEVIETNQFLVDLSGMSFADM